MRQVRSLPRGHQADAGNPQPHLRGPGRRSRRRAADRARRDDQGHVAVRPGADRLQPRALHHPALRLRVRGAHSRQALPRGRLPGLGACALRKRLPGQRRHPRLHLAGGRETLCRGLAAAPRAQPVRGDLLAGVLPHLRRQVPPVDAGCPGFHPRHQAIHGRRGSDHPAPRGPRKRAERPAQDRHRRRRPGRPVLRLLPGPAGLSARGIRGRAAARRDARCKRSPPTACRGKSSPARCG